MLNLSIAMRAYILAFGWIFLHWLGQAVTPTPEPVSITSPMPGAALQGQIVIEGTTDLPGFTMAEVWYSYSGGDGAFLIGQQREPVRAGELGIWDTTIINDGNYELHLRIFLMDGSVQEFVVSGLRVRNSSPIETNTPEFEDLSPAVTMTVPLPTATARPTATILPPNPAAIQQADLGAGILLGSVIVLGVFILAGVYLGLRKLLRQP